MIIAEKMKGELLSELLMRIRAEQHINSTTPITYAGRLDPMAEGKVLLLVGEEVHQKEKYLAIDKTYEFEIVFGISTDTHDVLGCIDAVDIEKNHISLEQVSKQLSTYVGNFEQQYPAFSSKTVRGIPLFELTKQKQNVVVPFHMVSIRSVSANAIECLSVAECAAYAVDAIGLVHGDFRQKECVESWNSFLNTYTDAVFYKVSCSVTCGTGMYVRMLARDCAKALGTVGMAWSIRRSILHT